MGQTCELKKVSEKILCENALSIFEKCFILYFDFTERINTK